MVLIAFSWDDGAAEDLKLMDLSGKYNIPGIFFIPASNSEREVMSPAEIKILSAQFEIGAHTYSHKYLTNIDLATAEQEIVTGKDFLEQLLGRKTDHFCFPGGQYNDDLVCIARQHFSSARTADTGAIIGKDSFLIRPAFHFYDRGRLSLLYNSARNNSLIFPAVLRNIFEDRYFELLKQVITMLNNLKTTHKIIVWGHSWEIEQHSLWLGLEDFFQWLMKCYSRNLRTYSELVHL